MAQDDGGMLPLIIILISGACRGARGRLLKWSVFALRWPSRANAEQFGLRFILQKTGNKKEGGPT